MRPGEEQQMTEPAHTERRIQWMAGIHPASAEPSPNPNHFTGGNGGHGENELGGSEPIHSPPQRHGDTKTKHGRKDRDPPFVPLCLCGESSGSATGALGFGEIESFLQQRFADQDCTAITSAPPHLSLEPCVHERASGGRPRPLLRQPGFGLEKLQRAANGQVIVQFPFLLGSQTARSRFGRQFIGPVQIAQRELQAQECPGFGGRKTPHLRLNRSLPNSDWGVVGNNRIHRPSPCPVLGAFQARIPPHFTGGSGGHSENESGSSEPIHPPRIGEPQRHEDTKNEPPKMDRDPTFVPLCLCGGSSMTHRP